MLIRDHFVKLSVCTTIFEVVELPIHLPPLESYVTTVGATTRVAPEVGASFSSGGFSRLFPQPSYQVEAVSEFLAGLGSTYAGLYNPAGRAYPGMFIVIYILPILYLTHHRRVRSG